MRSTEKTRKDDIEAHVNETIPKIWERIRETCAGKGFSVGTATSEIGMNPSAVYAILRDIDAGKETKDFELYLIKTLCEHLNVDIDWIIHGVEGNTVNETESKERIMDSLRLLSGGSMKAMLITMIPFLTKEEQDAMMADLTSRLCL